MVSSTLLQLSITPIKLNIHTEPAAWKYSNGQAHMQLARERHGLTLHTTPGKLHIDTSEARSSIRPSVPQAIKQNAQKGQQAAMDAAASYARQGKQAMEAPIGEEVITQFVKEEMQKHVKTNIGIDFIPKAPARISYTPRQLEMKFEADRLQLDWKMDPQHLECTPADVQLSVGQYPKVDITYTGQPNYFPRSAVPEFRPFESKA